MNYNSEKTEGRIPEKATRRMILAAIAIGTFMSALDSSVVNIALPSISKHFNSPLPVIEWVVMSYLLVISSLLLTYGRLGDLYGHKKIYLSGFVVFTCGSLFCGLSPTIAFLIAARIIQAVGAGMLMAMGPAIVTETTPPEERGKSLGVTAVAVSVALTAGPVIGGFLTGHFGWQSIFYINLPVGLVGILWAYKVLPDNKGYERQPFDIAGAAVIFLALAFLLIPLSYTETYGWKNPYILIGLAFGLILLILFIYIEKHVSYPMMDLSLFTNRLFSMGNLSALLNFMAQFSIVLLMPFYLQQIRGLTPSQSGLLIIPMPLATMLIAPISGIISDHMDTRYISSAGMGIAALGLWQLSNLHADSSNVAIVLALVTAGIGVGMFQTPNNSAIMGTVPPYRRGIASGILATTRNVGMVLGIAISGAIFSTHLTHLTKVLSANGIKGNELKVQAFTGSLHLAYTVAVVLAVIAVFTSLIRGSTK